MNGARWAWLALIGSIAILFAASSQHHDQRLVSPLRADVRRLTEERNQAIAERNALHDQARELEAWTAQLHLQLAAADRDIDQLRAEREALRHEVAKLSLDRGQLQQNILSLQHERAQTKRSVDQLRHGLNQLLAQAESLHTTLAQPAPGMSVATFVVELKADVKPPALVSPPAVTHHPDEPLNDNQ
jgi:predicted RNase H-like nuclease (RuvC/YqgF family)